jgi:hypothetical protein
MGSPITSSTSSPLTSLRLYLSTKSPLSIWRHFLGHPLSDAPQLLDRAVFVGLDLEWFEFQPAPITEIGLTVLKGEDLKEYKTGEPILELLSKIKVYHSRVIENAHFCNRNLAPTAASKFRFGETRWVTIAEGKDILRGTFGQCHITPKDKQVIYTPVILLGHGLSEDIRNLRMQWDLDLPGTDNVVYTLETNPLAKEAGVLGEKGVSLEVLSNGFGITPHWCHNAGNDIAYTTIIAILIGLRDRLYGPTDLKEFPDETDVQGLPIDDILTAFEEIAKAAPQPTWGVSAYCYRCESAGHLRASCKVAIEPCATCKAIKGPKNKRFREKAKEHSKERCASKPYYKYEPLPDWVKALSKPQRREFQLANAVGDAEALGRVVLAAYPAP